MPYGSARDLPQFREMQQQLLGLRIFGILLPKDSRRTLKEIRANLQHLTRTVDSFYNLLGRRNWVFHNDLNVTEMAAIVSKHSGDPAAAEDALIAWYQTGDQLEHMVQRLHSHEPLRARMHLLREALSDYKAHRYYAVVQVLLSIMDGFANDLNPANRRGLHTRDPEELDAWGSVVGHHLGLTSAHKSFTKSFRARNDDPVHDLYRNGIVHGMLTNYNNAVVATKAWNRLFAVADWAGSLEAEKRDAQKPPDPSWRELATKIQENAEAKAAVDAFKPRVIHGSDAAAFYEHAAHIAATEFLQAWQRNNYGTMAARVTKAFRPVAPVDIRRDYQGHSLTEFRVIALNHSGAAVCLVSAELTVDGSVYRPELRWVREGKDGRLATPNVPGEWRLIQWGFPYMVRDTPE